MRRPALLAALVALACGSDAGPEGTLAIRVPGDHRLFRSVATLSLRAERNGIGLATETFPGDAARVSLPQVSFGQNTIFTLEGLTAAGDLVARGRTCPVDFEGPGPPIAMYFAPVNFFAPTVGAPSVSREDPIALPLPDGQVLVAGGADAGGPVASVEVFAPATASFSSISGLSLGVARRGAEIAPVDGGALVSGGMGAGGMPVVLAEIFQDATESFVPLASPLLGRVGHRAVSTGPSTVMVLGGWDGANLLNTSAYVQFQPGATSPVIAEGPMLLDARRDHAAVVAVGVPVVFGGQNDVLGPLTSVEVLQGSIFRADIIPPLSRPRVKATATVLDDGRILVVGGFADATLLYGAEIYNPITQIWSPVPTAAARAGHTATLLANGEVLVVGGDDLNQSTPAPLGSVELYVPDIGSFGSFVSERSLGTPRSGHVAVLLCDGTVLVTGGGAGAEIYNPPAR